MADEEGEETKDFHNGIYYPTMRSTIEYNLKIAILLTTVFFIVELVGGWISGSLSLLSDAGHMFRDIFALIISLGAINIAKKLPSKTKTFGYHRVEIFSAFLNGLLLLIISFWIFFEAYQRFNNPKVIETKIMFLVAVMGLLVNLFVAYKLRESKDLNVRSAFLHVFTDAVSSMAVILASVAIFFTGEVMLDSILGAIIGVIILYSSIGVLKESVRILLEFTPKDVDFDKVVETIEEIDGVEGVHNVHIWSLCSNINVFDAHIYTSESNMSRIEEIKRCIKERLKKYNIKHSTLEFEYEECKRVGKIGRVCH